MAKKNWIAGAIKNPGSLTRKAKSAGKTVSQFIEHPPKDASDTTMRQINLAKTLKKMSARRKKS